MSPAVMLRACLLAACLAIALAASALAQDAAALTPLGNAVPNAQVKIMDTEVLPNVITVTVGAQVFWSNNTDQEIHLSDRPLGPAAGSLYLPFVKAGRGSLAAAAPASAAEPTAASWSSEPIAPSGQFSRTFAAAGTFLYYTSHLTGTVSTVVVLSDTLAATVFVDAEVGGVVEAGGSRLEIPPGALAQDTTIVLSQPITGMTMQADGMQAVKLEPAGLQLNQPATLTIPYGATGSYDEDLLQVVTYQASGGDWQPQPVLTQDQAAHEIALAVSRLDYWLVYIPDPLYIVLHLPAQRLKPGYMVAGLSGDACAGKSSWFPGRTAIYSGTVDATEYYPGTPKIIEALAGETQQPGCPASGEVRQRNLDEFPELYCTLRMGALYPPGASDAQLAAAAAAAHQQIGKGYLPVGGGNWQPGCFSSSGLVEYAYRQAGIGVVPPALEGWPITPLQLARKLRPVEEITMQPEQLLSLRAELIYWEANAAGGGNYQFHWAGPEAVTQPPGSYYDSWAGNFSWTPARADGGKSYQLQFVQEWPVAGEQHTVTRTLSIHVGRLPNAAPTAGDDTAATKEATATTIDVLANDSDPDGDALTITAVSTPAHGSASAAGSSILYTPAAGYLGSDAFTYTVSDGEFSATASVTLSVAANNIDPSEMVFIPAGQFQMGCDPANPAENGCSEYMQNIMEQLHTVNLSAYYIDKYEVTNDRYKACVDAGACTITYTNSWSRTDYYGNPEYVDYPVLYLTWSQANTFCAWEGKRLPTEAEWEKAARGSSDTRIYPWGNEPPDCSKLNFASGDYPQDECVGDTARVGSYPAGASAYGVMDMAGNVTEWVNDRFEVDYYSRSPINDPQGPTAGTALVVRGGAWDYYGPRVAQRYTSDISSSGTAYLGFRCARSQ